MAASDTLSSILVSPRSLVLVAVISLMISSTPEAVDSTAAGDSFIGGFCAVYERERDVERSIEMGQKAAALSVTRKGAQTSIPTMKDIQDFWS